MIRPSSSATVERSGSRRRSEHDGMPKAEHGPSPPPRPQPSPPIHRPQPAPQPEVPQVEHRLAPCDDLLAPARRVALSGPLPDPPPQPRLDPALLHHQHVGAERVGAVESGLDVDPAGAGRGAGLVGVRDDLGEEIARVTKRRLGVGSWSTTATSGSGRYSPIRAARSAGRRAGSRASSRRPAASLSSTRPARHPARLPAPIEGPRSVAMR